jgi:hypothetical protein
MTSSQISGSLKARGCPAESRYHDVIRLFVCEYLKYIPYIVVRPRKDARILKYGQMNAY